MRILHIADVHLDTPFRWAPPAVARIRRIALRTALERACALAKDSHVDAMTCGGDLYEHDRFTPDTARFLQALFADLDPLPIFLAPGNHDWYGPSSLYRQVEWSPNVHVFEEARLEPVELEPGFTLWGAAHRAPANTDGFLDGFRVDRSGTHIAIFHGSESADLALQGEEKKPHAPFRVEQIEQAGLHHALLGHFHTPRDAQLYTYPGNPDPLTFGEEGERGAVLLTVAADGSVTRERHRVSVTEVRDVPVDVTGASHAGEVTARVAREVARITGIVRVTLSGELDPDVNLRLGDIEMTARHGGLEALVVRAGQLAVGYDLARLRDEPGVRGEFVREVERSPELDEVQRRRVLITGLRALDGRREELEVY